MPELILQNIFKINLIFLTWSKSLFFRKQYSLLQIKIIEEIIEENVSLSPIINLFYFLLLSIEGNMLLICSF